MALAVGCLLWACQGNGGNAAVPRQQAYPRIETYDTVMATAHVGNVDLDFNAAADISAKMSNWLDINYPRYGVTVNLSVNKFEPGDELTRALANRQQRIGLNFGDVRGRAEQFTNPAEFECLIVGNPEGGGAPIHLLATRSDGTMLSGAAVFNGPTHPVESIAPIYKAVYADMVRLLLSLK